jgi:hypothetical protein
MHNAHIACLFPVLSPISLVIFRPLPSCCELQMYVFRMCVNVYFSILFPGDSLRNLVLVWRSNENPRGALEGIFIDLRVLKRLIKFPRHLLLAVWEKIDSRERGFLRNPPSPPRTHTVATFLDIQHNLHGT